MTESTEIGEAGRLGEDVRSDLHVLFEARTEGGVDVEITSKVKPYFGSAMEEQATQLLDEMGVGHGRLVIHDGGALPFAIAARIEAAVRRTANRADARAGVSEFSRVGSTTRNRLRRSRLYVPGNEPKYFVNAGLHGADGIILDLEDSVHVDRKDEARILVRNALRSLSFGASERMVRINQLPLGLADLEEVVPEGPDLILIPKVETPEQVAEVDTRITEIQRSRGVERDIWLMPILESALGLENAFQIALVSPRNVALTIGLEDFTADLGVPKTREGGESQWARQRLVNAAKASGLQAIDSVFGDFQDMEGLEAWGRQSRALGFEGMGCIHPRQIEVIHRAFAPTAQEIEKALRIVSAFETAQAEGLGVVSLGSKMVDPPVVDRAVKLVAQARAMGLVQEKEDEA